MKIGVQTSHDVVWCAKAKKGMKENVKEDELRLWSRRWPQGKSQRNDFVENICQFTENICSLFDFGWSFSWSTWESEKGNRPTSKEISKLSIIEFYFSLFSKTKNFQMEMKLNIHIPSCIALKWTKYGGN